MTSIKDIDPLNFAGGIGHLAAGQLFSYLARSGDDQVDDQPTWYGKNVDDSAAIEADVMSLTSYVSRTNCAGEQLWRWGNIHGLVTHIPESGQFTDLPIGHRLAFEMFATVSRIALEQIDAVKLELTRAEVADALATPAPGLKLEDSIFEPHGSLGDQEDYQKQFLADTAAADARRLEEMQAADQVEERPPALTAGSTETTEADKPAPISVGKQGDDDEEGSADQRQEAGDQAPADTSAQGDISGLSDDDTAEKDTAGEGDDDGGAAGGEDPELVAPVEQSPGEDPASKSEQPVTPKKSSRRKSAK